VDAFGQKSIPSAFGYQLEMAHQASEGDANTVHLTVPLAKRADLLCSNMEYLLTLLSMQVTRTSNQTLGKALRCQDLETVDLLSAQSLASDSRGDYHPMCHP
jgi:hypothetical protein